jgi:hypothetical protein
MPPLMSVTLRERLFIPAMITGIFALLSGGLWSVLAAQVAG